MSTLSVSTPKPRSDRGKWIRFTVLVLFTAVVLAPIIAVFGLSLRAPIAAAHGSGLSFASFRYVVDHTQAMRWLGNSLLVTVATVLIAILVAAPAGYAISRGHGRTLSGYSLTLFVVQSMPVVVSVIPLFILFAQFRLVDNLNGLVIIYVGICLSVAIWMMAAYFDSIPASLEEAAWMDGASVFGSFLRVVLRNSLPGVLSTAVFCFLLAWNDYLIVTVFLRSADAFTLPVGLQTFFQQNGTDWGPVMTVAVIMLLPPALVFVALNRYFSIGGIGGSLGGQ